MKKRVLVCTMALAAVIAMSGCGATTNSNEGNGDSTTAASTETDSSAAASTTSTGTDNGTHKVPHMTLSELAPDDYVVSIGDYKNLEIEVAKTEVTDEDVEKTIQELIESKSTKENVVGRALKSGDIANINYAGKINGEAFDGGTDDSEAGYDLEIGSGSFIPGFEDALIGMEIGETRDIDLVFPENYYEELAGKPVVFTVTLNAIKENVVPELTDEFVKENASEGVETVEELRALARESLESTAQSNYESSVNSAIMNKLIEICEYKDELPEGRYQYYYDTMYESDEAMATDYGLMLEGFVMYYYGCTDLADYLTKVKNYATKSTKLDLAVLKILSEENQLLTDEDVEKDIEEKYATYGCESVDDFKEKYNVEDYKSYLCSMKAIEIVKENLKIVEP